jgi:tetratricopeptide (TPR) repeat protein
VKGSSLAGVFVALLLLPTAPARRAEAAPVDALFSASAENPESVLLESRRLRDDGDLLASERLLREGVTRWPRDHDLLVALGYALFWRGLPPDALRRFDEALALVPRSREALSGKAAVLASAGEFDAAWDIAASLRAAGEPELPVRLLELRLLQAQGRHWEARAFAQNVELSLGPQRETQAFLSQPRGADARVRLGFETQYWGPLISWGTDLTLRPHELVRAVLGYKGSHWLDSREHRGRGAVLLLARSGFSFHVDLAVGGPGIRTPLVEVDFGAGLRIRRRVDVQLALIARAYATQARAWTLRVSASPQTWRGGLLDIALLGTVVDLGPGGDVLSSPGLALSWTQDLPGGTSLRAGYGIGFDVYWDGATRTAERALSQRVELALGIEAHPHLRVEPALSLGRWGSRPIWYGAQVNVVARL